MAEHLIGLMLGAENDWPTAFEALMRRAAPSVRVPSAGGAEGVGGVGGEKHTFTLERISVEPFSLRYVPRHRLVIDRAAWWYTVPREWLKKIAIMNEVYLLNNPFTFQCMEKHTAYCVMMRLGLNIPETWLLPLKTGPNNERWQATAERYNRWFDLDAIAEQIGYPMYMKPFDGGGWRGVSRIETPHDLHRAYDMSGQQLMHLQKGLDGNGGFDHFVRSLSIGPQTRIMRYRPERPMHERYEERLGFLDDAMCEQVLKISRLINAYFRWEFNSCETIVKAGVAHPIDYANACPDVAITSLHVHFPWAMTALLKWTVFCAATGRLMTLNLDHRKYFAIADRGDLSYEQKLEQYFALAEEYFETQRFEEFCVEQLGHVDAVAHEYFTSREFDDLLVQTVREMFPPHEHDAFIARYRLLFLQWAQEADSCPQAPAAKP